MGDDKSNKVPVGAAYGGMILIWSTGPLTLTWSVADYGYTVGSLLRFSIAALFLYAWLRLSGRRLAVGRRAWPVYALSGLAFFGFLGVASGARYVPSGWIGISYGLSPLLTALMSRLWLADQSLTLVKVLGMLLGIAGLSVIFLRAVQFGPYAAFGLTTVLVSVTVNCATSVWIRRIGAGVPALSITAGGVLLALPVYLVYWQMAGGAWPQLHALTLRGTLSLLYISIVATGIVFVLMYYVLKRLSPTQVSLVGLIAPVLSLLLGHLVNDEPLGARVIAGAALILTSLVLIEFVPLKLRR